MSSDPFGAVGRLFGYLLMAAGGMIAVASGLCTGVVLLAGGLSTMLSAMQHPEMLFGILTGLPMVALMGGVPLVIGIALWKVGSRLAGRGKKDPYA